MTKTKVIDFTKQPPQCDKCIKPAHLSFSDGTIEERLCYFHAYGETDTYKTFAFDKIESLEVPKLLNESWTINLKAKDSE